MRRMLSDKEFKNGASGEIIINDSLEVRDNGDVVIGRDLYIEDEIVIDGPNKIVDTDGHPIFFNDPEWEFEEHIKTNNDETIIVKENHIYFIDCRNATAGNLEVVCTGTRNFGISIIGTETYNGVIMIYGNGYNTFVNNMSSVDFVESSPEIESAEFDSDSEGHINIYCHNHYCIIDLLNVAQ